jgi:tRNA-dihydrouridine synthase
MVQGMVQASTKPITVKMRMGVSNDRLVADRLLPLLRDVGVVAATVRHVHACAVCLGQG